MTVLVPTNHNSDGKTTANEFLTHWYSRFGLPETLVSDRDCRFLKGFLTQFVSATGIDHHMPSTGHKTNNGTAEGRVKYVKQILRNFLAQSSRHDKWARHLKSLEFAINGSGHSTIGLLPVQTLSGHQPNIFPNLIKTSSTETDEFCQDFVPRENFAFDQLIKSRVRQADNFIKKVSDVNTSLATWFR